MLFVYVDSNLEYKYTIIDFSKCKTYTISKKPVVNQYFLSKVMDTLLIILTQSMLSPYQDDSMFFFLNVWH